jgi:hypothetical protein
MPKYWKTCSFARVGPWCVSWTFVITLGCSGGANQSSGGRK